MTQITLPLLGPLAWIDVILLGWFALTAGSVVYVAWDAFTNNPEMTVMKWGWVLVTLYLGLIRLFLYVMSCKEPAAGTHEEFIKPLWKQGLGDSLCRRRRDRHHHRRDDYGRTGPADVDRPDRRVCGRLCLMRASAC